MTKLTSIIRLLLIAVGMAAPLHAQNAAPVSEDKLRAGDVIKLWIWREPDLSGEFVVPENGVVIFPKIGELHVTDRTTSELKAAVISEYQKYLRNSSIELTFLRRVNVLGAVKQPGIFPVDETMTIANVLALAGGATPNGKPSEVELFRNGTKLVTKISERTRVSDLRLQSGDQLFVPERSWASRNTGLVATMISGLVSVAVALAVK